MAYYEHIFMARQDVSSQRVDDLVEHFRGVLSGYDGSIGKIENWGLKMLPYRVRKNRKAHYALMNITAPPSAIFELERQMRLHEDILRYLTVRVDSHEEGPSAMLRKDVKDDVSDEIDILLSGDDDMSDDDLDSLPVLGESIDDETATTSATANGSGLSDTEEK